MKKRTLALLGLLLILGGFGFAFINGFIAGYKELKEQDSKATEVTSEQVSETIGEGTSEQETEQIETTIVSE